ncbi:hypothetical protein TNCV_4307771 [Trichonephila clavipes]|nr:hypothetical protein TNCV_4307771 [Trichonephila clavipes]
MLTSMCQNSIKAGSLRIKGMDYHSVTSQIALLEIQPLPFEYRIKDLGSIERIRLWVAEILARHPSPSDTVNEMWHRLEAAWDV